MYLRIMFRVVILYYYTQPGQCIANHHNKFWQPEVSPGTLVPHAKKSLYSTYVCIYVIMYMYVGMYVHVLWQQLGVVVSILGSQLQP